MKSSFSASAELLVATTTYQVRDGRVSTSQFVTAYLKAPFSPLKSKVVAGVKYRLFLSFRIVPEPCKQNNRSSITLKMVTTICVVYYCGFVSLAILC